ncbi:DUF3397 family protein [Gracilibacillus boraciitolerans]|nr:DUF3397 family protein [Gracilibacillus boraciitolerans]
MAEGLYYILAFMITLPFLMTYLVYKLSYKILKHKWYSIHLAVNSTTGLYVVSVGTVIYSIFSINLFGYILIVLLIIFLLCTVIHWQRYTDIVFMQVWKRFQKVTFLLFFALHIVTIIYGIIYNISLIV